jgi:hypothetical protein
MEEQNLDNLLTTTEKEILEEEGLMPKTFYTLKEILELPVPDEIESLPLLGQKGFIHKGFIHLLAGYPKSGKTELLSYSMLQWGRENKILYVSEENKRIICERFKNIEKTMSLDEEIKKNIIIVPSGFWGKKMFIDIIAQNTFDVVIVDTLRNVFMGEMEDEKDASLLTNFLIPVIKIFHEKGTTSIFSHHLTKMPPHENLLKAVAGSHALVGLVDTILILTDAGGNKRRLTSFSRIFESKNIMYEKVGTNFEVVNEIVEEGDFIKDLQNIIVECLENAELRYYLTAEVEGMVKARGVNASRNQVLEALRGLYRKGKMERDPKEDRRGATYRWKLIKEKEEDTDIQDDTPSIFEFL